MNGGKFYVLCFVSRLTNPVNSKSVWNRTFRPILVVSIATAKMFVNMVAKAIANTINAKPMVVHSMP